LKRSITDVLRRGILNTLANWPVMLLRILEVFIVFGGLVAGILGLILPLFLSADVTHWKLPEGDDAADVMAAIVAEHAALWIYLLVFLAVAMVVIVAVHAFFMAGSTRIFVDGERAAAGPTAELRREQFAAFRSERWMEGARRWWVRLFWIYNGTYSVLGLIVLVPLLITALLMYMGSGGESPAGVAVAGCGGLALSLLIAVPAAYLAGMWTQKAVVVCVGRDLSAREAMRIGWREVRGGLLQHFVVYFLITIISSGAGGLLSGMLTPFAVLSAKPNDLLSFFTGPVQISSFGLQMAVAAAVQSWLVACFAAMTEDH
jgi:hypothetical protein